MFAIDCGNSRIKWARLAGGRLSNRGAGALADAGTMAALAAALADSDGPVLIANVAGAEVAARLGACVESQLGQAPGFVRVEPAAHGIVCGYREPQTLGVDRWLAMIAARQRVAGAFVVIGAGTALTFDAVAADGRHLGGLILPGDALMIDALAGAAWQIDVVPRAGAPVAGLELLGRSTAEAVGRGSRFALAATIDRGVAIVAAALGVTPQVLVTGGDAAAIAPWLESQAAVSADLVLEGIAVIGTAAE
jgi:type III pantothenate kinase